MLNRTKRGLIIRTPRIRKGLTIKIRLTVITSGLTIFKGSSTYFIGAGRVSILNDACATNGYTIFEGNILRGVNCRYDLINDVRLFRRVVRGLGTLVTMMIINVCNCRELN